MSDDTAAFDSLVELHYGSLHRFALSLSPNDADDLTQQTFFVAQTRVGQLRDPSKIKSWLSTTLRRFFLQRCRHESRFPKHELDEVESELPSVSADFVSRLDREALLEALEGLEERLRTPIVLYYLKEFSYKEIAAALNTPVGTVMSRVARGKSLLRKRLRRRTLPQGREFS